MKIEFNIIRTLVIAALFIIIPVLSYKAIGLLANAIGSDDVIKIKIEIINPSDDKNHYDEDSYYDSIFNELSSEVIRYIDEVAPESRLNGRILTEKCLEYGVNPILALSQGHLESHFGTKGLSAKTNNIWNTYAFDKVGFDDICSEGKYANPNESIEPYIRLLKNRYLDGKCEDELLIEFTDNLGRRYASNPNYEAMLRSIYNRIEKSTSINSSYNLLVNNKFEGGV